MISAGHYREIQGYFCCALQGNTEGFLLGTTGKYRGISAGHYKEIQGDFCWALQGNTGGFLLGTTGKYRGISAGHDRKIRGIFAGHCREITLQGNQGDFCWALLEIHGDSAGHYREIQRGFLLGITGK